MSLSLAPLEDADELAELSRRVHADPVNRAATGWGRDDAEEAIASLTGMWLRRFDHGWTLLRIQREGRTVGLAGYGPTDDPDAPPKLGVYLLKRGEGLGTKVARLLMDRARKEGAEVMEAINHTENEASRRLLERLGFEAVGPYHADWTEGSGYDWVLWRRPL